jgi:two-component system, chemotaxis family, chemotaxis protein CheY
MLNVLIVEDTATFRMMVRQQLLSMNMAKVYVAADGAEALQTLKNNKDIDLIVSDWHMAPMDGLTFCGMVQQTPSLRGRQIPVVFMTGDNKLADEDRREKVLAASRHLGIIAILPKPFTAEQLRSALSAGAGIVL